MPWERTTTHHHIIIICVFIIIIRPLDLFKLKTWIKHSRILCAHSANSYIRWCEAVYEHSASLPTADYLLLLLSSSTHINRWLLLLLLSLSMFWSLLLFSVTIRMSATCASTILTVRRGIGERRVKTMLSHCHSIRIKSIPSRQTIHPFTRLHVCTARICSYSSIQIQTQQYRRMPNSIDQNVLCEYLIRSLLFIWLKSLQRCSDDGGEGHILFFIIDVLILMGGKLSML